MHEELGWRYSRRDHQKTHRDRSKFRTPQELKCWTILGKSPCVDRDNQFGGQGEVCNQRRETLVINAQMAGVLFEWPGMLSAILFRVWTPDFSVQTKLSGCSESLTRTLSRFSSWMLFILVADRVWFKVVGSGYWTRSTLFLNKVHCQALFLGSLRGPLWKILTENVAKCSQNGGRLKRVRQIVASGSEALKFPNSGGSQIFWLNNA